MAVIHRTTLTPTKLELLAGWLPAQAWYTGGGSEPLLAKAGGFRLDDPEGEVGIEFMAVRDSSEGQVVTYHVPFTYRAAPLAGAEKGLIGTTEHGVLGKRWVYDGAHDPVLVRQLLALLLGRAEPQAQSLSNTPDPTVVAQFAADSRPTGAVLSADATDGPGRTDLLVRTEGAAGALTIGVRRILEVGEDGGESGHVSGGWALPDGSTARGMYVVVKP
ncbi:maltokinase N-terminal cap-like domain-containing protein [Streptomyces beijiangensis]|uniref:1,4-alpha-glucan branching protein n=1 Tax=Streptomyces beijiangensis TaxID=163361 RepID=A0A939F9Q5_9ACTN|nr:1,4-alpha-glucan branching protein [Streptomyces beijiangensis]MBO0514244.1 1,4-alpha-glucan branching protein [Streptomyces beijiangensis]